MKTKLLLAGVLVLTLGCAALQPLRRGGGKAPVTMTTPLTIFVYWQNGEEGDTFHLSVFSSPGEYEVQLIRDGKELGALSAQSPNQILSKEGIDEYRVTDKVSGKAYKCKEERQQDVFPLYQTPAVVGDKLVCVIKK